MGSTVFALIFLSSGYLFLRRWLITRPHAFRWDGHALYFSVVVAALVLVLEAVIVRSEVQSAGVAGSYLAQRVTNLLETFATEKKLIGFGATALWTVPIAALSVFALNLPLRICSYLRTQMFLRLSCLGELEEFLLVTSTRNLPVMITLSSKKVYVGFSMEANAARDEKEWIRLEPLLSGYRDDQHEFAFTTDYGWLHHGALPNNYRRADFDILLPASDIVSVHAFDLGIYLKHFSNQQLAPVDTAQRPTRSFEAPVTKAEKCYWWYFASLCMLPPSYYFFGALVFVFFLMLTALCGIASVLETSGQHSSDA